MAEQVLYQSGDITISTARVVMGGKTFALQNVSGVSTSKTRSGWGVLGAVAGAMIAFGGLAGMPSLGGLIALCLGGGLAFLGITRGLRYHLILNTNSGEVRGYQGSLDMVTNLKGKIEEAIVARA